MTLKIYLIRHKRFPNKYLGKNTYPNGREWTETAEQIEIWQSYNGVIQTTVYLKRDSCPWADNIKFEDCEIIPKEINL